MESDQLRLRKKTLQSVLEQCQTALDLIGDGPDSNPNSEPEEREEEEEEGSSNGEEKGRESDVDFETDELRDLLKSKFESPEFLEVLEKLGSIHMSVSQCDFDDCASWDIVTAKDLWDEGGDELDQDDFVIVKKEDVVDGIACFMAAYLLSLEQAKELTPNQLQEALRKTFSVKKKKGKLQKAWDGSVVIYNVASWGATAIGIYQNPAIVKAASVAFWTSCRVISRLL